MESLIYRDSPEESLAKATDAATSLAFMVNKIDATMAACENWGNFIKEKSTEADEKSKASIVGYGKKIANTIGAYAKASCDKIINFLTSIIDFVTSIISSAGLAYKAAALKARLQVRGDKPIPKEAFDQEISKASAIENIIYGQGAVGRLNDYVTKAMDIIDELKVNDSENIDKNDILSKAGYAKLEEIKKFNDVVSTDETSAPKFFGLIKGKVLQEKMTTGRVLDFHGASHDLNGVKKVLDDYTTGKIVNNLKLVYQKNRLKNALIKAKRDAGVKGESRSIIATYNEAIKCVNKIIRWEVKSCHIELQALHAILSYKV